MSRLCIAKWSLQILGTMNAHVVTLTSFYLLYLILINLNLTITHQPFLIYVQGEHGVKMTARILILDPCPPSWWSCSEQWFSTRVDFCLLGTCGNIRRCFRWSHLGRVPLASSGGHQGCCSASYSAGDSPPER